MTSAACFLHHNALTTPARSPSQCYVAFKPAVHVACRVQKQSASEEEDGLAVSRRLALSLLVGAVAISSRISPADAAYGEAANVFGKPKTNTDFPPYNVNGFTLLIPSKWNPSKEVEFPGQVLRNEDNFDSTSNVSVIFTPTDKKSITDFGSPEHFLSQVDYLLGKQAYSSKTDADLSTKGGFESDAVAMANILESAEPVIGEKLYCFISALMRMVDGDEGGKHQLINAAVKDGKLFICKAQAGDKRWFKGARKFIDSTANSFGIT